MITLKKKLTFELLIQGNIIADVFYGEEFHSFCVNFVR